MSIIPDTLKLSAGDWKIVKCIEALMKPFHVVEEFLEGDKYITASMVPWCIQKLRELLTNSLSTFTGIGNGTLEDDSGFVDMDTANTIARTITQMKSMFDEKFGADNTDKFSINIRRGLSRSRQGLPPKTYLPTSGDFKIQTLTRL